MATRNGRARTNGKPANGKPANGKQKFERFIDELIEHGHFRTRGEIARACGTTDACLSQVLYDPSRRLTVEQCLRLAHTVNEAPSEILRTAGQGEAAKVLDDLWPRKRDLMAITRGERELVNKWRQISRKERLHLGALLDLRVERAVVNAATTGRNGRAPDVPPTSRRARAPARTP